MKIIIIGAGICGLTTYRFLRQHLPTHSVHIYEAHAKSVRAVGGGLGLGPNGTRVLHALDPAIVETLRDPANSFAGQDLTMRNSQGGQITRLQLGHERRYGFPNIMTARSTIFAALEKDLPADDVTYCARVRCVRERDDAVEVEFEDGRLETCDLLLGADGVRSAVRPAVVGIGFEAQYHGLSSVGSFIPIAPLPQYFKDSLAANPVVMTLGGDGSFGYSPCSGLSIASPRLMWWSTFASATPLPRDLAIATMREQLLARHAAWVGPEGHTTHNMLIEHGTSAAASEVIVVPTWITPPLARYAVSSGRVVLLGDAAHAMPPESGQGASLALEDAQAIVLLLQRFLGSADEAEALRRAAEAFQGLRKDRVDCILVEAKKRGETKRKMGRWEEWMRDWTIWAMSFLPASWLDWKLGYEVGAEVDKFLAMQK